MTGYEHPRYARSLAEFGEPHRLPHCGGWVLERGIPGFPYRDAMGSYPLFSCPNWAKLRSDLEAVSANDWVSLVLVTDPFGSYDKAYLHACFPERVIPFKEHFIVDLHRPQDDIVSRHHRYYAHRALSEVVVERCAKPLALLEEWVNLYAVLVERHRIGGIRAFSRTAFAQQLVVPGLVAFRAAARGVTIGIHLWYVQHDIAYSHLAAFNEEGYARMASYALLWSAIEHLSGEVRWLNLGAGAGTRGDAENGLSWFKRGWSTDTRTAYLCGRIFDRDRYNEIITAREIEPTTYFPAYREGEFE